MKSMVENRGRWDAGNGGENDEKNSRKNEGI